MNTLELQTQPKTTANKNKKSKNSDKLVGKKRKALRKDSSISIDEESKGDSSQGSKFFEYDQEYDSDFNELSGNEESANKQLIQIEAKIQQADLSKRERRLLQNRKSALKCRLKKQNELDKMKKYVDKLVQENRELKEKISAMNALLQCKTDENTNLNKKFSELQFQQTLIIMSYLNQNNQNNNRNPANNGINMTGQASSGQGTSQPQNSLLNALLPQQMMGLGAGLPFGNPMGQSQVANQPGMSGLLEQLSAQYLNQQNPLLQQSSSLYQTSFSGMDSLKAAFLQQQQQSSTSPTMTSKSSSVLTNLLSSQLQNQQSNNKKE